MRQKKILESSARPKAARALHEPEGPLDAPPGGHAQSPARQTAREALELLTRSLASAWPRRGHNLLELQCGNGHFLEMFWQSGFDVTGQEDDPELLAQARTRMRNAAEFTQAAYPGLPYDDRSFDHVVCLGGLERAERPLDLVREMFRLATHGVLLAFPCSWSLHGLGSVCKRRRGAERLFSPLEISALISQSDNSGYGKSNWAGTLYSPAWMWGIKRLGRLNLIHMALPFGAVGVVRVDFNPPLGTGSVLTTGKRPLRRQMQASGLGRSG